MLTGTPMSNEPAGESRRFELFVGAISAVVNTVSIDPDLAKTHTQSSFHAWTSLDPRTTTLGNTRTTSGILRM